MEDESNLVQVEAGESTMELLDSVESPIVLLPTDFKVFQLYIFPAYQKLNRTGDIYIRSLLMKLMGKICTNGRKFIEQGITNQTAYFKSLREKEKLEESKGTKQEGMDFYIGVDKNISNLDTEMEAMEGMISSIVLDTMIKVSNIFQGALIPHVYDMVKSLGRKTAMNLSSSLFSMLNTKSFPLVLSIFKHAPKINLGLGINWVTGLFIYFDSYIIKNEELLTYYVLECFSHLAKSNLLKKEEMIELYEKVTMFLLHPNTWIRTAAIGFCKAVGSTQSDAEFFLDMRKLLHHFVKDFIMVAKDDPFQDFLRAPSSRFAIDIAEARIPVKFNYIAPDEYAKTMFEVKYKLEDLCTQRNDKEDNAAYTAFASKLKNTDRQFALNCVGDVQGQVMLLGLSREGMPQTDELKDNIYEIEEGFEMAENEADEYIDKYYDPQILPDPKTSFSDNNGMNPRSGFINFHILPKPEISWRKYFKNATLCKSLNFYKQEYRIPRTRPTKTLTQPWKPQGRLMTTLNSHEAPVQSIGISDSTLVMVTGDANGMCCIWDASKLKDYYTIPLRGKIVAEGKVTALKFLQASHTIAVGTNKGAISVFKLDNDIQKEKYIPMENEGGVVNCCTYHKGYSTIVYATQRGRIHVHDLRVKKDVNSFDVGSQRGLVTTFCMGPDEYSYFAGTGSGYVSGYDIRFNLVTTICRHTRQLPIMDMCTYVPEKGLKLGLDVPAPLLFIATSGSTPQIDLCYLNKEAPEWSFAVGDSRLSYQSFTPYGLCKEECVYTNVNRNILKQIAERAKNPTYDVTNGFNQNSLDPKFAFKDFNIKVQNMYDENTRIYKILCPRISLTEDSAPFLLTTGADRVVRYWWLGNIMAESELKANTAEMVKNSLIIVSPDNREVEYAVANFKEKVLFEKPIKDSKVKMGQSTWQEMNGITQIKNQATKAPYVNHTDAILNMELLESFNTRFLVTCGRDNLVKLWS